MPLRHAPPALPQRLPDWLVAGLVTLALIGPAVLPGPALSQSALASGEDAPAVTAPVPQQSVPQNSSQSPSQSPSPGAIPGADGGPLPKAGESAVRGGRTSPGAIPGVDGLRGPTAGRGAAVPAPGAPADTARAGPHAPPTAGPAARADLPRDLSPAGMFLHADRVVKAVMILLGLASLATWVIWLAKMVEFAGARRALGRVALVLATARRLDEAAEAGAGPGPAALMIAAAGEEAALSAGALDRAGTEGMKERVASALDQIEAHALRRMRRGTGILATIGATAPFVGLFGTVWGIMNAFVGISQAQTTNLAVVAPGIAEALMATAAGLVAAIPAVVIYNLFTRRTAAYRAGLRDVAAGIERLVSRDADYRRLPGREG